MTKTQNAAISHALVSSTNEIPGYRIVKSFGIVRGITVRSRNFCSFVFASCGACCGGQNTLFTQLCEEARDEALRLLCEQGHRLGGNAIVGFAYQTHDVIEGIVEVLAYGTCVQVEPLLN